MSTFDDLARELDAWGAAGRRATLWWRDDDAEDHSEALERLLALASSHAVPLALAVIPAGATERLADRLAREGAASVLQHGFDHRNRSASGAKRSEFPPERDPAEGLAALTRGRRRLDGLFGPRALPVLVPPWNRIAPAAVDGLAAVGFEGLSTFGPRRAATAAGVRLGNTHVDVVAWKEGRGFFGLAPTLELAVRHLAGRRTGRADEGEPTGLLTHHRVHDDETWAFIDRFLRFTRRHGAVHWLGGEDVFQSIGPNPAIP